jgi:hypothetical protein
MQYAIEEQLRAPPPEFKDVILDHFRCPAPASSTSIVLLDFGAFVFVRWFSARNIPDTIVCPRCTLLSLHKRQAVLVLTGFSGSTWCGHVRSGSWMSTSMRETAPSA